MDVFFSLYSTGRESYHSNPWYHGPPPEVFWIWTHNSTKQTSGILRLRREKGYGILRYQALQPEVSVDTCQPKKHTTEEKTLLSEKGL